MSIQNTNYEISTGQDLNQIFAPLVGIAGPDTGLEYYDISTSTYKDLSQLFLPYASGTIPATNFFSNTGEDLKSIFQAISQAIWSYVNFNNQNTRHSIYNGPPASLNPLAKKWQYTAPVGTNFNQNSLVIGPTGIIYLAENSGFIYALIDNGSSASSLFSINTGYTGLLPPTIGLNNIMYITLTNVVKAIKDINTALPVDLWSLTITASNPSSPIIGSDGTLYISTSNGYIYAVSSNGSFKWSYNSGNSVSSLAIGSNGTIYASASTILYAINSNGTLKWSYNAGVLLGTPSIGSNGTIYAINSSTIYAITDSETSGTPKWNLNVGTALTRTVSIGNNGILYLVTNTTVISVTDGGNVGSINWTCNNLPPASQSLTAVSIGLNGTIYTTGDYGLVVSITDNGVNNYTINWAFQNATSASSPCSIGSNGTIYFGGGYNAVVAI